MGVNVAEYEINHTKSEESGITSTFNVTKDFTNNAEVDFEPFCNYYTDHDEPEYIIPRLEEKLIKPYVMMVFYDTLLHNDDRHNQNAGVLRDSNTGEIIGLAPYFDYNLGLISTGVPRIDDINGNVFTETFLANEVCRKILKTELPDKNAMINSIEVAEIETKRAFPDVSLNYELIKNYIIRTYDFLANAI